MSDSKIVKAGARPKPPAAGKGRVKGTPNKATKAFRETVQRLLEDNSDNISIWLTQVASEDPGKALDLISRLAEFAAPKLARTEVVGADGGPVQINRIERVIVDGNN
jgi:hypothetical protein